ncbi:hypothetical protein BDD12DRAFT_897299 [Trichophaea hybrida]|nr:hypothetical protein BDD12DRAFT_897299 [Trichophaea hybrida]
MEEQIDWEMAWDEMESGKNHIAEQHLARGSKKAVDDCRAWWSRFNKDALSKRYHRTSENALELAGPVELKLFLMYRIRNSRSHKQQRCLHRSTVQAYYKTLQMVYSLDTKRQIPKETNVIINKYIETELTQKFKLIMELKDKPTCSVTDLFNLLHYHWNQDVDSSCHGRYRIQVAFLMQLIAYTSSRPGSIIESHCYKGLKQVLKYKDMNLSLLRKRNKREPVTYILYERRDNPIFCPIMNLLALAFADNAFKEEGIQRPEDLYNLEIPHFKESLVIQWKPECRETPVFRRHVDGDICDKTPLTFSDFNYYLKRLGLLSGYPQTLTSYVLRRGAANAVDCPEVTEAQRNQIMGHARADVFRRHYMHQTVKVDTQSAYLGTVDRADLIKNIGLMSTKRDPRAPVKIQAEELELEHPRLTALLAEKGSLALSLKDKHGTIKTAETAQPELHRQYTNLRNQVNALKKRLERDALANLRATWFENVDHEEIKQQLKGQAPSTFTYVKVEFDCPLRSVIAAYHSGSKDSVHTWADVVRALASLCSQKSPLHSKLTLGENQCPVCFNDDTLRLSDRLHSFHATGTLRTHIHRKHSDLIMSVGPVNCPYASCEFVLECGEHLKNHIATVHNLNL